MLRHLALCIGFVAFIFFSARVTQQAAGTLDAGIRPLGKTSWAVPPGVIFLENDSYYWLRMAERMEEEGTLRIRRTHSDNPPAGRPVYWSQSIAWLIRGFAALPWFANAPRPLESASLWVNPFVQAVAVVVLYWILLPLGMLAALLSCVIFLALGDVAWAFSSLRPDHQSLQAAFATISIGLLLREGFGFGRPRFYGNARSSPPATGTFVASGALAGMGFWVSAAAMMPIFATAAFATILVSLLWRVEPEFPDEARRVWLVWGASAAGFSLFFWLVEFAPDFTAVRLEVNGPLFSLWLLGLGLVVACALSLKDGKVKASRILALAIGLLVVLGVPAAIYFGPAAWYAPRDVYMERLHNFIMEFYTFANFTKGDVLGGLWRAFQFTLPLGASLAWVAFSGKGSATKASAAILLLIGAVLFLAAMSQVRWFALFAPMLSIAAGVAGAFFCNVLARATQAKALAYVGALVIVALVAILGRQQLSEYVRTAQGKVILNELVQPILNKRFAMALGESTDTPMVVMGDPDLAPSLQYFARVPSVVSFYWENTAGARDAALFFADTDGVEAHEIALRRGVTHVIVPGGTLFANYMFYIKHGRFDESAASETLAAKLCRGAMETPEWLQLDARLDSVGKEPMSYKGEKIDQYLSVYRVVDTAGK